jgi:hypothetical protein
MRILVISDLHCGHRAGLTPPRWQIKPSGPERHWTKREKFSVIQKESWEWYSRNVKASGPYGLIVCNGDAIDGRGERSGGTELIATDLEEQCDMAEVCIQQAMSRGTKLVMTYGTAYHTGQLEDWENRIASNLKAEKIGSHEWIETHGKVFDFKHHIGSSGIPHGRHTAVSKDRLWNLLWAARSQQPNADVLIRSHVHYFQYCGDSTMGLRMTTPALQTMGSKYGSRRCSGVVDFGFIVFDVDKSGMSWGEVLADLPCEKASVMKI